MKRPIKEILFKQKTGSNIYFDLVNLEDIIFKKKPSDHNQFTHHKLSFYVIIIVTNESGKHNINYTDYTYERGTVFTIRRNNIHKFYKSNAKGKLLVFTEDFIARSSDNMDSFKLSKLFNEMLDSPKLQLVDKEFVQAKTIINLIEGEYLDIKDEFSLEVIRSMIQVLILKLSRLKSNGNENIEYKKYYRQFTQLQELVMKEGFENKSVSYYADKMGVSSRTLSNITHKVIGKSAKSFIDEIVILQIKRLLINSPYSFTEIAYLVGFDQPTNFFKYFRKMSGFSPKQFKEEHS